MNITENKTVAEVVTENIKTSHIFKKYGIDFCCGGGMTIDKACKKKGVDFNILAEELRHFDKPNDREDDFDNWSLSQLIDYIVAVHHSYVEENIPLLLAYTDRVAKVHGHHYEEVIQIDTLFREVAKELSVHMKKEELILFPFIKKLVMAKTEHIALSQPHFGSVNNPIHMMEQEHEDAGDIFKTIALLSNNYAPPEGACNTFKALYDKLNEFEQDLHTHIHLENNILHPKAIVLEKAIRN